MPLAGSPVGWQNLPPDSQCPFSALRPVHFAGVVSTRRHDSAAAFPALVTSPNPSARFPLQLAGVVTNLLAGLMGAKWGIKSTLLTGLSLQLVGIGMLFAWQVRCHRAACCRTPGPLRLVAPPAAAHSSTCIAAPRLRAARPLHLPAACARASWTLDPAPLCLQDTWSKTEAIIYVTATQLMCGIAKDLTKLGGKTVTKLVTPGGRWQGAAGPACMPVSMAQRQRWRAGRDGVLRPADACHGGVGHAQGGRWAAPAGNTHE